MPCISPGAWTPCYLSHWYQAITFHLHCSPYQGSQWMDSFLLLIRIVNVPQFFELQAISLQNLTYILLEFPHHLESVLLVNCYSIVFLHEIRIPILIRGYKAQRGSWLGNPGGSTHPVDVFLDLTRQVILENPSNILEIQSPRGHISANKESMLLLVKPEIVIFSLLLVQVPMQLVNVTIK